ncbi:UDP-N-acetylmuramoylalanyl-D-glutamate--2,6-diaminopimelate ligase [Kocuria rhizophila]|uniref:UDP-N-acetylmuramoyl-L-alanyl-D-glutamate--2, 6-diaminopimelate ligase n=1 Tax=Kocuria rhizophila TaxID=72000 RepID=UPI00064D892B|nr:UDP-N-acetylmuramoyl-L-alanyl-D-glutamate--2,6-diaminopimelate ligase [Kocuria rhizophila]KMK73944.1 UDP-N-acetylmuramoylalanyl-D-glutamate--2,6-diaminopimelate ligase [Kocuria rhizophila]MDR7373992.1 UDP-N-acetylmuramoyl-L-alanyl-D-glutamate--2,6-diaminopimelate ligase [Kocuria rhizophila]QTK30811.1 UDP-N-acetylmuramoyl-L-alanyl-D-glutamate--2,6-diaminopimelate ligase [Kocuria rhizophila]
MVASAREGSDAQSVRPSHPVPHTVEDVARLTGARLVPVATGRPGSVTGVVLNSREVQPGDLYAALPGARVHGARFASDAAAAGAVAVLTDPDGAAELSRTGVELPVLVSPEPRQWVGSVASAVYGSQPEDGAAQKLFAVTGTNGKTTTTYFTTSVLRALGHTTGLIGTIEILAGDTPIPSQLTTPEAPHVHSLLALMRERGITATAMEVSSHALEFHRVDGVRYDVAGFTNLTQDHLDLHGSMPEYFEAKAQLFTAQRTRRAVVVLSEDDPWGAAMARRARENLGAQNVSTVALRGSDHGGPGTDAADWTLSSLTSRGIGTSFVLRHRDGRELRVHTGLPGDFNVANAALAVLMVLDSGVALDTLQRALDEHDPLTASVPGRMELVGTRPTSLVDFAHNPDALVRALRSVDPEDGRVIVVFGATGERDTTKRPVMGRVAAEEADVVIVTDDDPHGEDPGPIREQVAAGAREAVAAGARASEVLVIEPRATAIRTAVRMARPEDSVIVAGRGHETVQDVDGVDVPLDDRVELREALAALQTHSEEQK